MNVDGSDARQLTTYPGPRRVARLGRQPAPGGRRRHGARDAVAARSAPAVSLGTFRPGRRPRLHGDASPATVTSTAGNATLSVLDTTGVSPGHLVNGTFALPQPLQVRRTTAPTRPSRRTCCATAGR